MKLKNILSINADSKTVKGVNKGYLTGILYLAPATLSGKNLCKFASKGCKEACLYSAGRGRFNNVQKARLAKSEMFNNQLELFMKNLIYSIEKLVKQANKKG